MIQSLKSIALLSCMSLIFIPCLALSQDLTYKHYDGDISKLEYKATFSPSASNPMFLHITLSETYESDAELIQDLTALWQDSVKNYCRGDYHGKPAISHPIGCTMCKDLETGMRKTCEISEVEGVKGTFTCDVGS